MRFACRHCGSKSYWMLANGERRCKFCKRDFRVRPAQGIRLSRKEWVEIIDLFLLGVNSPTIREKTDKSMGTVTKALKHLRICMATDVPKAFSGTLEVDETYLGGQKKNKSKNQLRKEQTLLGKESKRGKGTTKQAVFGILARNGQVWAELVSAVEDGDLLPLITKQVKSWSRICSDTWRAYTGLAAKGYVHRTVEHKTKEYVRGKNHINGLEGFWGFLKRKLASKGGVRRIYLPLFLGEYVWRYNHRKETLTKQRSLLLKLITNRFSASY